MVANIRSGSSPGGALYYNKEKVDKDEAEVLFQQKMLELYDKRGALILLPAWIVSGSTSKPIAGLRTRFSMLH